MEDREIRVGESRLYLDEDNILNVTIVGDVDLNKAKALREAGFKLRNIVGDISKTLIDLNKAGMHSSEARKIWKESSEYVMTGKAAYFGLHPVARVIASFLMGITKKRDVRFFKSKEEALTWLNG